MAIALLVSFALVALTSAAPLQDLPVCNINTSAISVSGLSAGGFMAVQFHVAYSATVMAAGIVAGGPYYCAQDEFTEALTECMNMPESINVQTLIAATDRFAAAQNIDATSNLAQTRIYLYSGTRDTVVHPQTMKKLQQYYEHYVTRAIQTEFTQVSEHGFPTLNYGIACTRLGEPYILKCNYDAAQMILENAYGTLRPAVDPIASNIVSFEQSTFASPLASLYSTGYAYIPSQCRNTSATPCRLHVSFHGCEQSVEFVQQQYVEDTGLNGFAESNGIVVLYPQCAKNILKDNPNGCFDWWGYTGSDYVHKSGKQMAAVKAMIDHIAGKTL